MLKKRQDGVSYGGPAVRQCVIMRELWWELGGQHE